MVMVTHFAMQNIYLTLFLTKCIFMFIVNLFADSDKTTTIIMQDIKVFVWISQWIKDLNKNKSSAPLYKTLAITV